MQVISLTQKRELYQALTSCFVDEDAVHIFLRLRCEKNLNDISPKQSVLPKILLSVLEWSMGDTRRLSGFVRDLMDEFPDNRIVCGICQSIRDSIGHDEQSRGSADPYDAVLLPGGRPFVDRIVFRDHLRSLPSNYGQRIIGVAGPSHSGKSYSLSYITFVSEATSTGHLIWIDVTAGTRALLEPNDLASGIMRQIGKSSSLAYMPTKGNANPARWVIELRDWIVGELNQTKETERGEQWWLVADGICHPDVPPLTRDLVRHLCKSAHVNVPCLRVILLDTTEDFFPADIAGFVKREQITGIGRPEVQQCFERLASTGHLRINAAGVQDAVNRVFSLSPNGSLTKLSEAIAAVIEALR